MSGRWEESEEIEDCRHCDGTGIDESELDGDCVHCMGKGANILYRAACNDCGCEAYMCDCDTF